jgi:hypothetical protein
MASSSISAADAGSVDARENACTETALIETLKSLPD